MAVEPDKSDSLATLNVKVDAVENPHRSVSG
jgi:hypothetical protein